jgi:hypothetical protein
MEDAAKLILRVLDSCVRGDAFPWDALASLERRSDLSVQLAAAVHELHHFADDADIRSRDTGHADYWKRRLEEIRAELARA